MGKDVYKVKRLFSSSDMNKINSESVHLKYKSLKEKLDFETVEVQRTVILTTVTSLVSIVAFIIMFGVKVGNIPYEQLTAYDIIYNLFMYSAPAIISVVVLMKFSEYTEKHRNKVFKELQLLRNEYRLVRNYSVEELEDLRALVKSIRMFNDEMVFYSVPDELLHSNIHENCLAVWMKGVDNPWIIVHYTMKNNRLDSYYIETITEDSDKVLKQGV